MRNLFSLLLQNTHTTIVLYDRAIVWKWLHFTTHYMNSYVILYILNRNSDRNLYFHIHKTSVFRKATHIYTPTHTQNINKSKHEHYKCNEIGIKWRMGREYGKHAHKNNTRALLLAYTIFQH